MSLRQMKRIGGLPEPSLQQLQDHIIEWTRQLERVPWLDGVLLEGVDLASGANTVTHKLGRVPRGWLIVKREATAAAAGPVQTDATREALTLDASGTETVSLWVW